MHVFRSKTEPQRVNPTYQERWEQSDRGLILAWERGRELAEQNPELAASAKAGELPVTSWKGGIRKPLKPNQKKYGSLYYLAMWQGLRGEDLSIDNASEIVLVCTKHHSPVIFTSDKSRFLGEPKDE